MVSNENDVDGESVVQLYVSDLVTSATWVSKELKGFQKVFIPAHTSKRVHFEIPAENFSIVNAMGERLVEPGKFEVQVGPDSRDENLLKAQFEIKR